MDGTGPRFGKKTVDQPLLTGGMEGTALDAAGGLACPWLPDLDLLLFIWVGCSCRIGEVWIWIM